MLKLIDNRLTAEVLYTLQKVGAWGCFDYRRRQLPIHFHIQVDRIAKRFEYGKPKRARGD